MTTPAHCLRVGDHVVIRGIAPDSPEYDIGSVVGFTFSTVKVHWARADVTYTENYVDLERVPPPVLT